MSGNGRSERSGAGEEALRVEWAVVADYALVDAAGKLSVIGIFSNLWAASFPALHPVIHVVAAWAGEPNRLVTVELRLWGPGNELILSGQQQVQLGPNGQANGIFQLAPLALPSSGRFTFELLAEGKSMSHVPLDVAPVGEA